MGHVLRRRTVARSTGRRSPGCAEASTLRRTARARGDRSSRRRGGSRPALRVLTVVQRLTRAIGPWCRGTASAVATPTRRRRAPSSPIACGSPPKRSDRRTSSSARSSRRARACSPPSWSTSSSAAATRCRPSRSRRCATTVEADLGQSARRTLFAELRPSARWRPRRSPRCTPPACITGEPVVVKVQRPAVSRARPRRPAGDGLARPAPRRADPGQLAGQPAGARRAVRRDDRRGARLPHRGGEHDRHRHRAGRRSTSTATSYPGRIPGSSPGGCW